MRILVVGSQGQVASELALLLSREGCEFRAVGRPALDLADLGSIRRAVADYAPHAIINAAAYTAVDRAEDEPALADAINGEAVGVLGEAAALLAPGGVPVIHYSTDYVFDGSKPAPYVETDPTRPIGAYGASKLLGEQRLLAANPRSVVLRTAWVCSRHGHNFVKTMLRLGRERPQVKVVADQLGAPTFAADLAAVAVTLLSRVGDRAAGDPGFGVFHYSGAPDVSWHGFADAIFAAAAERGQTAPALTPIATAEFPTRARRPANSRLDCGKIAAIHGIARPDWRHSLAVTLDHLMEGAS